MSTYKDSNGDIIDSRTGALVQSGGSANSNAIMQQNQANAQAGKPSYSGQGTKYDGYFSGGTYTPPAPQQQAPQFNQSQNNFTPPYAPGESAKQSAGFNGSNFGDMSGVYINDKQASHKDAIGNNPLHYVNTNRNSSIQDAIKTGDWQPYYNFSAGQAPGHYDLGGNGNYTPNKEYFASLIESNVKNKNAANSGQGTWNSDQEYGLQELIQKMNSAPGMMPYIPTFNSNEAFAKEYGVSMADPGWFNSQYNNPQVRQDGRFEQNMWYDNAVFKNDPTALENAMNFSNSYGSPEEQELRQSINNQYYTQQGQQQPNQMEQQLQKQKEEYDAYIKALEEKLKEQEQKNDYTKDEQIEANKGGSGGNKGEHIFAPGTDNITSNTPGYTQSNNSLNDLLYKYLDKNWQGGF